MKRHALTRKDTIRTRRGHEKTRFWDFYPDFVNFEDTKRHEKTRKDTACLEPFFCYLIELTQKSGFPGHFCKTVRSYIYIYIYIKRLCSQSFSISVIKASLKKLTAQNHKQEVL